MAGVRIGVDVGGTFTHAVAISDRNGKIIGRSQVLTTHTDRLGVARGVILSLRTLIKRSSIRARDVSLVAHSTTQATNALLEGDVASVGVISVGSGLSGFFTKLATGMREISLWDNKAIRVHHAYYDDSRGIDAGEIANMITELRSKGAKALVVAEAFSTEDCGKEKQISAIALKMRMPCTATSEISGLYGLRARTKTAVINASILPKMTDAAEKTLGAIRALKISAPVMVVRSDGGILSMDEMRKRPILTILSGPAAGVGAALFHEKLTDGIFIEVGGTSTDISLIKDGAAQVRPARIGAHRLHLKTLDVKTLGIAGGSLPRIRKGRLYDVGPRSAHIAGLKYVSFSKVPVNQLKMKLIRPGKGDPQDYLALSSGKALYALTPTCASNCLGHVPARDHARGDQISIKKVFDKTGLMLDIGGPELAAGMLDISCEKLQRTVKELARSYGIDMKDLKLIGGGGGAAALVPYFAKKTGLRYKLAKDHEVISAIGTALSLVHESIERSVASADESEILRSKLEAQNKVIEMGALPSTVSVNVEVDRRKNVIRASAFGSLKMETKRPRSIGPEKLMSILVREEGAGQRGMRISAVTGNHTIIQASKNKRTFFINSKENNIYVLDRDGRIVKKAVNALVKLSSASGIIRDIRSILDKEKRYGDAGAALPKMVLVLPDKIMDLSAIPDTGLIEALVRSEMEGRRPDDKVAIIRKLG